MKKLFKRNQIIITALALLIAVSGYINYLEAGQNNGNKKSTNTDIVANNIPEEELIEPGDAILTSTQTTLVDKMAELKLNREQTRSKNLSALYEVVNNDKISSADKQSAIATLNKIVEKSEMELAIELMLEGKGFQNVIASISDESVDIMLNLQNIDDASRVQIEDMVVRKTGYGIDKIVITPIQSPVSTVPEEG